MSHAVQRASSEEMRCSGSLFSTRHPLTWDQGSNIVPPVPSSSGIPPQRFRSCWRTAAPGIFSPLIIGDTSSTARLPGANDRDGSGLHHGLRFRAGVRFFGPLVIGDTSSTAALGSGPIAESSCSTFGPVVIGDTSSTHPFKRPVLARVSGGQLKNLLRGGLLPGETAPPRSATHTQVPVFRKFTTVEKAPPVSAAPGLLHGTPYTITYWGSGSGSARPILRTRPSHGRQST